MLLSSFWVNWFDIDFTYFKLNLGWFAVVYSGLLVWRNIIMKGQIELSPRELHDWGDRLSQVTPQILSMAEQGNRPREIAAQLLAQQGIPELVSLKYMVVLANVKKQQLLDDEAEKVKQQKGN